MGGPDQLVSRVELLIQKADHVLATSLPSPLRASHVYSVPVDVALFSEWRSQSLHLLTGIFGEHGVYAVQFGDAVMKATAHDVLSGVGILRAIKQDLEDGYAATLRSQIGGEIAGDYLHIAEQLLEEDLKDPAAAIAGGVLERQVRSLATSKGVPILQADGRPKKLDTLNAELVKSGAYDKLDQKNVTAWYDIRTRAAHGQYEQYQSSQVQIMVSGIRDFVTRHPA